MMRNLLLIVLFSGVFPFWNGVLNAQSLRGAYFAEGYSYRHLLNPAFGSERAYFGFPGLGNLGVETNANVGLSDFLYRYDDPLHKSRLTTFMNKTVSPEEFLGNLHADNQVLASIDLTLFSAGFPAWGGFNTVSLGIHSKNQVNVPYELFDFMKTSDLGGSASQVYQIEEFRMNSMNYVDLVFGHSRQVTDRLRLGGAFKILLGAANVETRFDDMQISMGEDEWLIRANGYMHASGKGMSFVNKETGEIDHVRIDGGGIGGFGVGLDLGMSYQLLDNLTLSAAILDLGFIRWNRTLKGVTDNEPYSFKGFEMIGVGSDSEYDPIEDQFQSIGDDLKEMAKLYDGGLVSKTSLLGAVINAGIEYELPAYRKLSFGILSSTHFNNPFTWTEARASVNIAPVNWFEASMTGGWSTFGPGWGFLLNFHPKGFNFFLGSDFVITTYTPQYVPIHNLNANVCMGINFPIGPKVRSR